MEYVPVFPIINKHSKCSLDPSGRSMTFRLTEDTFLLFTPALSVLGQRAVFLYRHQKAWWRHDPIVGRVFRQTAGRSTLSIHLCGSPRSWKVQEESTPVRLHHHPSWKFQEHPLSWLQPTGSAEHFRSSFTHTTPNSGFTNPLQAHRGMFHRRKVYLGEHSVKTPSAWSLGTMQQMVLTIHTV